jgi:hypothetical protein
MERIYSYMSSKYDNSCIVYGRHTACSVIDIVLGDSKLPTKNLMEGRTIECGQVEFRRNSRCLNCDGAAGLNEAKKSRG